MIEQFTHLFAEPRYSVSRSGEKRLLDKEVKRAEKAAREATGLPTKKAVRAVGGIRRLQDMVCPHSQFYRIAYRAVASATNRRTFISTILPKGVYLGHSLNATIPYSWVVEQGALKTHNNYTVRQLLVVTSFFNSLTVDFIVRRKTDKNVSMFLVYQLPIPRLMEEDRFFDDICRRSALLICTTPEFDELAEEAGIRHGVTTLN